MKQGTGRISSVESRSSHRPELDLPSGWEAAAEEPLQNQERRRLAVPRSDGNSDTGLGRFQGKCPPTAVLLGHIGAFRDQTHALKTGSLSLVPVPVLLTM